MQWSHKGQQVKHAPPTGSSFQTERQSDYSHVKILTKRCIWALAPIFRVLSTETFDGIIITNFISSNKMLPKSNAISIVLRYLNFKTSHLTRKFLVTRVISSKSQVMFFYIPLRIPSSLQWKLHLPLHHQSAGPGNSSECYTQNDLLLLPASPEIIQKFK